MTEETQESMRKSFPLWLWLLWLSGLLTAAGLALYVVKATWLKFDPYSRSTELSPDLSMATDHYAWIMTAGTCSCMAGVVVLVLSAAARWHSGQ